MDTIKTFFGLVSKVILIKFCKLKDLDNIPGLFEEISVLFYDIFSFCLSSSSLIFFEI